MKSIGERFREFRESADLTQIELADLLGLGSTSYLSEIERGKRIPGARLVKDFESLEKSPTYAKREVVIHDEPATSTKRWGPPESMPPPHALPPDRSEETRSPDDPLTHADYARAVSYLSLLFDKYPSAFRAAVNAIRGIVEMVGGKP